MVDTQNLDKLVEASGKTKTFLAEKCGLSIHSLKNKFENRTEFKLSEVEVLCSELNITKLADKERIFFAK